MFNTGIFQKICQNLLSDRAFQFVIGFLADELGQFGSIGVNSFDAITDLHALGGFLLEFNLCAFGISDFNAFSLLNVVELHNLLPVLMGLMDAPCIIFVVIISHEKVNCKSKIKKKRRNPKKKHFFFAKY